MKVNEEILAEVVKVALSSVAGDLRWTNAIQRGAELIRQNRCTPIDEQTLLILSTSGRDYKTTVDKCEDVDGEPCPAFRQNKPCKHRASFQLLVRYREHESQPELIKTVLSEQLDEAGLTEAV